MPIIPTYTCVNIVFYILSIWSMDCIWKFKNIFISTANNVVTHVPIHHCLNSSPIRDVFTHQNVPKTLSSTHFTERGKFWNASLSTFNFTHGYPRVTIAAPEDGARGILNLNLANFDGTSAVLNLKFGGLMILNSSFDGGWAVMWSAGNLFPLKFGDTL